MTTDNDFWGGHDQFGMSNITRHTASLSMQGWRESIARAHDEMEWAQFDIPQEKFVEYEMKDREWLEYFGFIKRKPRIDAVFMAPAMALAMQRMNKELEAHLLHGYRPMELYGIPVHAAPSYMPGTCMGFASSPAMEMQVRSIGFVRDDVWPMIPMKGIIKGDGC